MSDSFVPHKDQSSLNRFFTESEWSIEDAVREGREMLLQEEGIDESVEYVVIDDTVCRKHSPRTAMVCYNHSSTMGTVLSHDYVTSIYVNNGIALPEGLKLYGSERSCKEKEVLFKTKVQLACELIDSHTARAKRIICLWDSWCMVRETVDRCKAHRYNWVGEIKSNRIVF